MEENLGALGATGIALLFVLAYSFWGLTILHSEQARATTGGEQYTLASK
jgi:hypothetical protein